MKSKETEDQEAGSFAKKCQFA